jgi:hypothetical protein
MNGLVPSRTPRVLSSTGAVAIRPSWQPEGNKCERGVVVVCNCAYLCQVVYLPQDTR